MEFEVCLDTWVFVWKGLAFSFDRENFSELK